MDTKFSASATYKAAEAMAAMLKREMDVKADISQDRVTGACTITMNNGRLEVDSSNASPKIFNKLIEKDFREYRSKGWIFTQPSSGSFTIGIPEGKVSEMDDSYANGDYKAMSAAISLPVIATSDDPVMTMGDPTTEMDMKNVTVYANSINPVSYVGDDPIVAFDVVFSVGMTCSDGSTKTYQVVKRFGVDRMKMANDAMHSTPVSIVEAKKPASQERFLVSTERARAMAGLK